MKRAHLIMETPANIYDEVETEDSDKNVMCKVEAFDYHYMELNENSVENLQNGKRFRIKRELDEDIFEDGKEQDPDDEVSNQAVNAEMNEGVRYETGYEEESTPRMVDQNSESGDGLSKCKSREPSNGSGFPVEDVKDDGIEFFGKYIASQLKLMPLDAAIELQIEIQSLVCRSRMEFLKRSLALTPL